MYILRGRWCINIKGRHIELSRLVMERYLGRLLKSTEYVHHKDEDPSNDSIENLQVMSRSEHTSLHMTGTSYGLGKPHPFSKETKEKISKALTGRTISNEVREKMSKSATERWRRSNGN